MDLNNFNDDDNFSEEDIEIETKTKPADKRASLRRRNAKKMYNQLLSDSDEEYNPETLDKTCDKRRRRNKAKKKDNQKSWNEAKDEQEKNSSEDDDDDDEFNLEEGSANPRNVYRRQITK